MKTPITRVVVSTLGGLFILIHVLPAMYRTVTYAPSPHQVSYTINVVRPPGTLEALNANEIAIRSLFLASFFSFLVFALESIYRWIRSKKSSQMTRMLVLHLVYTVSGYFIVDHITNPVLSRADRIPAIIYAHRFASGLLLAYVIYVVGHLVMFRSDIKLTKGYRRKLIVSSVVLLGVIISYFSLTNRLVFLDVF